MTKINILSAGAVAAGLVLAAPVFAASGVVLQNAGLAQGNNPATFGLGVCNKGTAALTGTAALAVRTNGVVQYPTVGPLSTGECTFTYLPYSAFNMVSGQSYQVDVNIDPQHLFVTNTDTQATYTVTVPGGEVLGASTVNKAAAYQSIATQLAYIASVAKALQAILAGMHF